VWRKNIISYATRKIPNPLSIDQAQKIIGDYASSWYITNIKNYYPDLHIDDIKACVQ
jgi:hypothetical protein